MASFTNDFADFGDTVWLNAASEGPMPLVAGDALQEAIHWKLTPHLLTLEKFFSVIKDLKSSIAALIDVRMQDVILANSASYGLHILANGLALASGDEIVVMQNDFPTNILPWLDLRKKGVHVIQAKPEWGVLKPEELLALITQKTKVFCVSHVHTFTGLTLDIKGLGEVCRKNGVLFILNISQSVGTMPINISDSSVDAVVSAGYKWLCGPYGTGFCWIRPEVRQALEYNQAYWAALMSEEQLTREGVLDLPKTDLARKYDVFATANFFNFVPFRYAIDYFLNIGIENIQVYHQELISHIINGLDKDKYSFISDTDLNRRSSLCVISHRSKDKNKEIYQQLAKGKLFTALWKGNIRISPHIYNTEENMVSLIKSLNRH